MFYCIYICVAFGVIKIDYALFIGVCGNAHKCAAHLLLLLLQPNLYRVALRLLLLQCCFYK